MDVSYAPIIISAYTLKISDLFVCWTSILVYIRITSPRDLIIIHPAILIVANTTAKILDKYFAFNVLKDTF